jgi:hypothetical protein
VTAGACVALLLSGCSSSSEPPPEHSTDPASTPPPVASTPADPHAGVKAEVEAAYRGYWNEKKASYAKADVKGTELERYAVGEARTAAEREISALARRGFVATGTPHTQPSALQVSTTGKVWSATLRDCVDVSGWKLIEEKTNRPVQLPPERRTRYISTVTLERWEGRWVVLKATQEDRSC